MENCENSAPNESYEEKFEQELEDTWSITDSYHDDQLEDLIVGEDDSISPDLYGQPNLPDNLYFDCDADLEKVLTNGNVLMTEEEIQQLIESKTNSREISILSRFLQIFKLRKNSFYDASEEVNYDTTPDSGVHEALQNMDPEQRAKLEEEWRMELARTEEEILTLRQVLGSHIRRAQDLKRKLGITVWKEFVDDMEQGIKNVKDSTAYQKTNLALKSATEKTSTVLGTLGASVSRKLGDVKNSSAFRSFEEKMGSAYTNVRTKVSGSRSNSMQNFEEVLEAAEGKKSGGNTPTTTPTIPEEKPIS